MPARVAARSPVHIFSTPTTSTGASEARAAMAPRCRAEVPLAHELSTLTIGTSPRLALRSQASARMQPWSQRRPPRALLATTRASLPASTPLSSSASPTA